MANADQHVEAEWPPFITVYKDGSVKRSQPVPSLPSSLDPDSNGVASKDVSLNAQLGLWARLFLPSSPPIPKLPLVLYFHGGGFLFSSPSWANVHSFCTQMAKRSGSICISASYRLAPEHRFPAAIDDAFTAFRWLHSQVLLQAAGEVDRMDPWLVDADFSKCFIAGESAGGVLAHNLAVKALNGPLSASSWEPLCIRGLVLIHPGFLRGTRTQEELDAHQDDIMNWENADLLLKLSLPSGSSKESPYFNPLPTIKALGNEFVFPKTLVVLANLDALQSIGLEYVDALKAAGCHVDMFMSQGVGHVFFIKEPDSEQALTMMQAINSFIAEEAKAL